MRLPVSVAAIAGACVLAAAGGGGCAEFDDPSTVTDLRVLAVRAEPSEIILNATVDTDLSTVVIPSIQLQALIVDPRGAGRPVTVDISVCANDPSALSPPNNGQDPTGYPAGGARTTVGSALCDGAPTEMTVASGADLSGDTPVTVGLPAAWVMNAFIADVFPGPDGKPHGGFDLGMPVVFQLTARAGEDVVRAIKRVTFWLRPLSAEQRANTSPVIPGVSVYDQRDAATAEPVPGAVQTLDPGAPATVPGTGLWIDPAPADAEPFVTAVLDRTTGQAVPHDVGRETLRYAFYATAGTFSPFETSSEPPPGVTVTTRVHIESKYQPPPEAQRPADVTMWIVVRDERGGASWLTRSLRVPATGGGP
ncbi:MAG: hypothetical protein ABUL77_00130 [Bacteroidota bacterium]